MSTINKRNPIARAIKLALLATASASVLSVPAVFAAEEDEAEKDEKITITGSRIKRTDIEGANPVTTITRDDILRSGVTNVGELLQRLPEVTGSPTNTSVNNGGDGSVRIDIRGLGRTLTLVNGRRTADRGDFQTIPAAMIERVDILKDGASAIYGSDAMAGVVNIITRKDFEGLQFQVQKDWKDNTLNGAGDLHQASVVMGTSGDKGHFLLGLDWSEQKAILQGDMPWWFMGDSYNFDPTTNSWGTTGSSRIPGGNLNLGSGAGGCGSVMFEQGASVAGLPANYRCFTGADLYNYAPVNYMQTPYERTNLFVEGDYEINDDTKFYSEIRVTQRNSERLLAPMPYDTNFDPAWDGGNAISADNYYNPFGEDIVRARRRVVEDNRNFTDNNTGFQYIVGVQGGIVDSWTYDVSYNLGSLNASSIDGGQFVGSRLADALGPSFYDAATDSVVCGTPSAPIEGCVSLNMFGGAGNITQEMLDYVGVPLVDHFGAEVEVINATVSGDVMELPAGTWGIAVGYEHQATKSQQTTDSGKATEAVTGNTGAGIGGTVSNTSFFVETAIPLLADLPGVHSLELNLGARLDDYSLGFDNTSHQVGLKWGVMDGLLVRATVGTSFRAPNVFELFSPEGDSFPQLQDPCNNVNIGGLNATQQANCLAQGVPAGGYLQTDTQLRARVGGNAALQPEEGDSLTVGVAWSPDFIEGFNMTLDYWDISIDDIVSNLSASTILSNCVNFGGSACDNVSRFANGSVNAISANQLNLGKREASGIDANFKYSFDTEMGHFGLGMLFTHLSNRTEYEYEGAEPWELAGVFDDLTIGNSGFPSDKASFSVDWSQGNWAVSYTLDYIGGVVGHYLNDQIAGGVPGTYEGVTFQDVPATTFSDIVATYNFDSGLSMTFGVTNFTNTAPPFIDAAFNASTDPGTYRLYGRSMFLRAVYDF